MNVDNKEAATCSFTAAILTWASTFKSPRKTRESSPTVPLGRRDAREVIGTETGGRRRWREEMKMKR